VRTHFVVVALPAVDGEARIGEPGEPVLVQAFVTEPAIEALHEGILDRFPRPDELQLHPLPVRPGIQHLARELRPVVQHDGFGKSTRRRQSVQHPRHPQPRQRCVHLDGQALPGEVVDDVQCPERPAVGKRVVHEVHRPALVHRRGGRERPALRLIQDLYSRRIVGWDTADRIDRWLTLTALDQALRTRRPKPGLIHHSDRGSQYASYEYQQRLTTAGAISSMSRKGDCYDNAQMESFFSSLKRERVHRRRYWSHDEATTDLGEYMDTFYNCERRHSQIGNVSPAQFEVHPIST